MRNTTPRPDAHSDNGAEPTSRLTRRTIVQGAGWTIPVVAVTVATPAAAASAAPTLAFTQNSYSGKACETLSGVQVRRTTDGSTADSGQTVSVTLADGYTFADGSTRYSGRTGSDGTITLPGIKVPAKGGKSAFSASSTTLSASAPVSGTSKPSAFRRDGDGTVSTYSAVPAGSTAIGDSAYLAHNGDLYSGDTLVASGVDKAHWTFNRFGGKAGYHILTYVKGTKGYRRDNDGNVTESTVPSNSTPIGDGIYLAPNGDVYHGGSIVIAGTSSAHWYFNQANSDTASQNVYSYMKDGVAYRRDGDGTVTTYDKVPTGSTAIGDSAYLAPNGDLYSGNTLVASGVDKASWTYNRFGEKAGYHILTYVKGTKGYRRDNDGTVSEFTVASDSTPIGDQIFRSPNGDVYHGETKVLEGTKSAHWYFNQANSDTASQNVYSSTIEPTCA